MKLELVISSKTLDVIHKLSRATGMTTVEIVERSIGALDTLHNHTNNGRQLWIVDKNGRKLREIKISSLPGKQA